MSIKKKMTLRRWLYEHSPMAEMLLREFDRECKEITSLPSEQPVECAQTFDEWRKTLDIDVIEDFCGFSAKLGWNAAMATKRESGEEFLSVANAIKKAADNLETMITDIEASEYAEAAIKAIRGAEQ